MYIQCSDISYPVGVELVFNMPIIKKMARAIKKMYPTEKIHLWCRGSSGSIIASIIASNLGRNRRVYINYVHKNYESRHSFITNVGEYKQSVHIVVDDFIASGETINNIIDFAKKQISQRYDYPNDYILDCLCITGYIKSDILANFHNVITNRRK
jgi:adenine/guanine phosphoribosyltransferase-like PRPP-binding protein